MVVYVYVFIFTYLNMIDIDINIYKLKFKKILKYLNFNNKANNFIFCNKVF